jgi:hypothetical protein
MDRWTERGYDRPRDRIQPDTPPSRHKDSTVTPVTLGVRPGCVLPVRFRAEDSPRGLWRSLGKRVGCKPSRVRIPHPPPTPKQPLTCGNAVQTRSVRTASHRTSRRPVSNSGRSFRPPTTEILPSAVQACSRPFADVRLAQPTRQEASAILRYRQRDARRWPCVALSPWRCRF